MIWSSGDGFAAELVGESVAGFSYLSAEPIEIHHNLSFGRLAPLEFWSNFGRREIRLWALSVFANDIE